MASKDHETVQMTTADKIMALEPYGYLGEEGAHGFHCGLEAAATLVESVPPQAVRVKPLVWVAAPQGYGFTHQAYCALMSGYYYASSDEKRREHEATRAARILAALDLTPPAADASPALETVSKAPSSPLPCKVCHSARHLRWHRIGSWLPGMPAVPYVIRCHNIEHDLVEGPEGYGQNGAIDAWNAAVAPASDPVSKTPTLDAMAMRTAVLAFVDQASIASCTCGIKSPNHEWHFEQCRYRTLQEVADRINAITLPADALREALQLPEVKALEARAAVDRAFAKKTADDVAYWKVRAERAEAAMKGAK